MLQLQNISFSKQQRIDRMEWLSILTGKRYEHDYGFELLIEQYKNKRPWRYKDLC